MFKFNTRYSCPHCKKQFVLVVGAGKFKSYLPIDVLTGNEVYDTTYSREKGHKSHLMNCKELQGSWESIKIKIDKQQNKQMKIK